MPSTTGWRASCRWQPRPAARWRSPSPPHALYRAAARSTLIAAEADTTLAPDVQLLFERFDNHWANIEAMLAQMLGRARPLAAVRARAAGRSELCARVNASLRAIAGGAAAQGGAAAAAGAARGARAPAGGDRCLDAAAAALGRTGSAWHTSPAPRRAGARSSPRTAWGPEFARPGAARAAEGTASRDLGGIAGAGELLVAAGRLAGRRRSLLRMRPPWQRCRGCSRAPPASCSGQFAHAGRVDYTFIMGAAREALAEAGEPTDLALRTGLCPAAHPGRRVPGHLARAVPAARHPHRQLGGGRRAHAVRGR